MFYKPNILLAFCLVCLSACNKESISTNSTKQKAFIYLQDNPNDCVLIMTFEMESVTYSEAVNPEEQEQLSIGERAYGMPKYGGSHVEACIKKGGVYSAEIQMVPPADAPTYPDNILKLPPVPDEQKTDRISIANNVVTSYNKNGDVISVSNRDEAEAAFYIKTIEALAYGPEEDIPDLETVNATMDAFRGEGLGFETYNGQYEVLTQNNPEGGFTKTVFDKTLGGAVVGHANFGSDGKITSKRNYNYSKEGNRLKLNKERYVTYFDAPISKKRMKMVENARYQNFMITSN